MVGIVALAVNIVILSGEIDVSVGSLMAVCAFVYGNVAMKVGGSLVPLGASLVIGALLGTANGLLVTLARVPSIIATLGMLLTLRGAVLLFGANQVIHLSPESRAFGLGGLGGVSVSALVLLLMFALFWLLCRHSTWGREVFAVGGNLRAARLAGLPVLGVKLLCFIVSGLACGLAAAVFIGQIGELQATAATGFELRVIAAVVLGGTSIAGGRGSVLAPRVGAVLVGVILNGMTIISSSSFDSRFSEPVSAIPGLVRTHDHDQKGPFMTVWSTVSVRANRWRSRFRNRTYASPRAQGAFTKTMEKN